MDKHLTRLAEIYKAIDNLYDAAMRHYDFRCEGCVDNCCVTKFYHHTNIEELYLSEGLKKLDEDKKKEILLRAEDVVKIHNSSPDDVRVMCPLNEKGLCIVYEHRPMICRIHGVPYQMFKKNMSIEFGTGCYKFINEKLNENMQYFMFNRTVFYVEMAKVEKELRESLNLTEDYKKTTAEMVVSILKPKS
ncbi:YkgJ family cysteine cluster protein [Dissulfurispira sp.]|uniref:YkgJ family cysteine cluster protein n=1 Tax=Dissulfurispira sp. TaxID=2817609 RepID=UPI002FD89D36